ncbi:proline--tRNA ligase [Bacillaceae bacterium]
MRQSQMLLPTLREVPSEAEIASHQLMLRAGMIRQLASGIYTYLPLGYRVLRKVEGIVREEMDRAGAQEIVMPAVQPAELWRETGRWDAYGPELMRLKDRHERDFVLGPTHEEVITSLVRDEVKSYKKLPLTLYQIQTKYRDEIRPRFGVIRAREFVMKDAYSFDVDAEGLERSYRAMYEAYERIFTRCGLHFRAVEADAGAIGGKGTHEFMALSDIGEDTIAYCANCSYAANIEKAEVAYRPDGPETEKETAPGQPAEMKKVHTPGVKSIEQLTEFLRVQPQKVIKSVLFRVDEQCVLVLVRGDHEVNEAKVKELFAANVIELADEGAVRRITGAAPGFAGPVGLREPVTIVADRAVETLVNAVAGANETDYHLLNVTPGKDFAVSRYADVRNIQEGDVCPRCGGEIRFARGIEVGHVFKLGTKYSKQMGATFLDENGKERVMIMGCYGIGISRLVAAIIEQNHDENGIIWPASVAPYQVHLITVNGKQEEQLRLSEQIYESLSGEKFEVLWDDRQERAGVKFKDSDLIGIPLRVVVGAKAGEGIVECKIRRTGEAHEVPAADLPAFLNERLAALR